jgi:hypothetical protein
MIDFLATVAVVLLDESVLPALRGPARTTHSVRNYG